MRIVLVATTLLVSMAVASTASAAENVSIVVNGISNVFSSCERLSVNMTISADVTNSDEPILNTDFIAVVAHDGANKYMPASYYSLQSRPRATVPFASAGTQEDFSLDTTLYRSAPLTIRVHDIADPRPSHSDTPIALIAFASQFPVKAELVLDPATLAPAQCGGKPFRNDELRILPSYRRTASSGPIGATPTLLSLNEAGATGLDVAVPVPSELVAIFRARCSNDAADDKSRANVDLLVDGVALDATAGSDDALCTSNGVAGHDQWVMARASGGRSIAGPGLHRVEVRASSPNGGESILDHTELTVMVPEPDRDASIAVAVGLFAVMAGRRRRSTLSVHRRRSAATKLGAWPAMLGLIGVGIALPTIAEADTSSWHTFTSTPQVVVVDDSGQPTLLDLGSAGSELQFIVSRRTRVTILFTAVCAVDAPSPNAFGESPRLDVDLLLDFGPLAATSSEEDSFCSAKPGSADLDQWVSASIQTTVELDPGLHRVQVQGLLLMGEVGDRWSIGDLSLLLIGQSN